MARPGRSSLEKLNPREWQRLMGDQGGVCKLCPTKVAFFLEGEWVKVLPCHADHDIPNAFIRRKPDQILCVPCHKLKTRKDNRLIKKNNRMRKKHETGRGRARRGRKLESRGFDKTKTRRFDGSVVPRV